MPSILFVCTANQTRSPIAAALFNRMLAQTGEMQGWRVESAGTWVQDGLPATRAAQRVMRAMGIDLSAHRTRCVTSAMLSSFDLILVMEQGHKEALQVEFRDSAIARRVFLLSEMVGGTWDVADPSGGTDAPSRVRETAEIIQRVFEQGGARIGELLRAASMSSGAESVQ
jgi:protein-tyrosine-phosphatase